MYAPTSVASASTILTTESLRNGAIDGVHWKPCQLETYGN